PNLVAWTTTPGEDFTELNEIYTETLGMWSQYMGHVVNWVGGMRIELKTAEQAGPVYQVVPMARQRTALQFLSDQAFTTPTWLANPGILQRLGLPAGALSLSNRQAGILTQLLDARRLARLGDAEAMDPTNAYPLATYMEDVRRSIFGGTLDANRRVLQRVYLERLEALVAPPPAAAAPAGAPPGFAPPPPVNTRRADIAPLARAQLRSIQADARRLAATATGVNRAHWQDLADRVTEVLERRR
ncbi:MAG: zinc-dependent metalloprotease, partial [Gemmatimonadetes bacterium]|nr:zinc-dependent metalloprotease [Gemmatimonadota bacterium]